MKSWLKKIPYLERSYQNYQRAKYVQNFDSDRNYGGFWGIFETFDRAIASAPKTKNIGYNDADLAQQYRQMFEHNNWENSGRVIRTHDYPILFWLKSLFDDGCQTIVDIGGNVGIHYYAYSQYLAYPEYLNWTICELPEIVRVGRELADSRSVKNLAFTSDFDRVNGADILLASGSIQNIEADLDRLLARYDRKPKHLLINRIPLYDGKRFVTLQNGGKVFYPQYVFNKTEFIDSIHSIGYEAIDIWEDNTDSCFIPFDREHSVSSYSGLYLKLKHPVVDESQSPNTDRLQAHHN